MTEHDHSSMQADTSCATWGHHILDVPCLFTPDEVDDALAVEASKPLWKFW